MVDVATIGARVNAGLGRAAAALGTVVTQYRPADPLAPLGAVSMLGTLVAAFDETPAFRFARPAALGQTMFHVLGDATNLAVGDYLAGASDTFFVVAVEPARAAATVRTDATVTVTRPEGGVLAGANPPGGDSQAVETVLLAGWPVAMIAAGRGDRGEVGLPGDVRMGWWQFLMPAFGAVVVRASDIVVDQNAVRHVVMSAEATPLGWRISAEQEAA